MLGNIPKTGRSKPVKMNCPLPSYFMLPGPELLEARRKTRPANFCKDAFDKADITELQHKSTCLNVSARSRNAILKIAGEAEKIHKIYFDRTELCILLHMLFQLTDLEVRDVTSEELKSFLYGTLDITNPFALDGICRASAMQTRHSAASRKNISPLDFLQTLSVLLRGSISDRAEFAFHVMDVDSDGLLRKTVEFRRLLFDTFDVTLAAQNPEIDPEEPVRDTINYLCDKLHCTITQPVNLTKFKELASEEPWIIECLLPCIPSELTNILFQSMFTTRVQLPSLEKPPRIREKQGKKPENSERKRSTKK